MCDEDIVCQCGHLADEHRFAKNSFHECEVVLCDCCCFEPDEDSENDEEEYR